MSLSKYYKSSNSFQPEELIKHEDQTPSGWQSSHQQEQLPFQAQELPVTPAPKDEIQTSVAPPTSPSPDDTIATDNTTTQSTPAISEEKQTDATPSNQAIDLSNYLELAIAEEKIAKAYQKGLQTGKDKTEQDFVEATKALLSTCQQLDTIRETIIGNSHEELQEFALAIAERILRISIREQDSTIIATIEEALQSSVKSDEFTIYIHPEDHDTITKNSAEIIAGLSGLNKIVIKKDITVERGGAKIESDNCTIDATIASQFDMIREEIKKNL